MKIQSHASALPPFQREGVRPAQANRAGKAERDAVGPAVSETPAPKTAPPGLERVLARLEAMGETGRTQGQSQAMDRIARNLARYQENQALAPLPEPEAPAVTPSEPEVVEVVEVAAEPEAAGEASEPPAA